MKKVEEEEEEMLLHHTRKKNALVSPTQPPCLSPHPLPRSLTPSLDRSASLDLRNS